MDERKFPGWGKPERSGDIESNEQPESPFQWVPENQGKNKKQESEDKYRKE